MKKLIALILVAGTCLAFSACGGKESESNNSGSTQKEEQSKFKREITEEGNVVISKKEFASYITKVELTTENWKEYLEIAEVTTEERNGFGEVAETDTSTLFTVKDVVACYFDDVAINFNVISTGQSLYCEGQFHKLIIPDNYNYSWNDYSVEDLKCEKIVGDLLLVTGFPDDCLSAYEDGGKYICVGTKDDYMKIDLNDAKGMSMDISLAYAIYN